MKLDELIVRLQDMERDQPGLEVFFDHAIDVGGGAFSSTQIHLIDARPENGNDHWLIVLADRPELEKDYKRFSQKPKGVKRPEGR